MYLMIRNPSFCRATAFLLYVEEDDGRPLEIRWANNNIIGKEFFYFFSRWIKQTAHSCAGDLISHSSLRHSTTKPRHCTEYVLPTCSSVWRAAWLVMLGCWVNRKRRLISICECSMQNVTSRSRCIVIVIGSRVEGFLFNTEYNKDRGYYVNINLAS